jgi:iron complex outermembrane receptor protein
LSELIANAILLDLRANLSLFTSKVDTVPGPNNRINDQPRATGNLGADYRFRESPFTVGGNIAFTPAYSIQNTDTQRVGNSRKRVIDCYALWAMSQATKLRLTLSNLAPRGDTNTVLNSLNGQQVNTINNGRSAVSVGLKLEMRL